jgi:hypothetical protein
MSNIEEVKKFLSSETGLATVSTVQKDGRVLSSIVNCGVIDHPGNNSPCVAFVSAAHAARLNHIRRGSEMTVAIRRGWSWRSVTGSTDLLGPQDLSEEFNSEDLRLLLREVFESAGGTHEDWDEYDRVMSEEKRVVVLVAPERILGNY